MSRIAVLLAAAGWLLTGSAASAQSDCVDLKAKQDIFFSGALRFQIFAGPPNYKDVHQGDAPEPAYILTLPYPICLSGDPQADPKMTFSTVQLLPDDQTAAALRALANSNVDVTLKDPFPASTGHHHAPLVASVAKIGKAADELKPDGTAATTVRGFYDALHAGSGDEAARFIVPELRVGPFAPPAMTAFYGKLAEPLQVVSLDQSGLGEFLVRYHYRASGAACNGRAVVSTTNRNGGNFISYIRALDGC